jgi:hypothetical protein
MIGNAYITSNLVLPFFHTKPIKFRNSDEKEFRFGHMDVQVFADGSCNIQILNAGRGFADWHGVGSVLDSRMLEKILWDGKEFVAIFE